MPVLVWLLTGLSAIFLLLALFWGWSVRCKSLLRDGHTPLGAAWRAWEMPFQQAVAAAGALPVLNEWRQQRLGGLGSDPLSAVARATALSSLLALGLGMMLLFLGFDPGAAGGAALLMVGLCVAASLKQGRSRLLRQARCCRRELPFFLDLLVLALQSGLGVQQAWVQALEGLPPGSLHHALAAALSERRAGRHLSQAVRGNRLRARLPELNELAQALDLAQETGLSLAALLKAQGAQLRYRLHLEAEQRALKLPVYLLAPLVLCIFPCTFVVLGMTLLGPWLSGAL